ncbi:restriction endonuclease subunit S [Desulfuromonas thiophila]|uniref:restriction endonuclease subunit S n=1 Tax=Desulfuromonas thiophila TaxID=57664 RepID=UPI0029F572D4|nr:restriction endonuclease subunit S [Desulfuromonas thiophila]
MGGDLRLGDVAKVQGGFAFKSKDFERVGIPVVKIKNVRKRDVDLTEVDCVSEEVASRCSNFYVREGDVLISMTGSGPNAPASIVGRVARHSGNDSEFLINQRVGRFINKDDQRLELRYLYYFLSQSSVQDYLVSIATGSANQVNISAAQIESLDIPLPSLDVQKSIAHILGTLDDKIELNRQMNATLEAVAQALFKSWFVDFDPVIDNALAAGNPIPDELQARADIRAALGDKRKPLPEAIQKQFPSSFVFSEEMGWIPEGWEVLPILQVCDMLGGTQPPASTFVDNYRDGYVRLLQIRDFTNDNHITYVPDSPKLRRVEEDEILIGRYGSASGDRKSDSLGRICRGKAGVYNVALMKLSPVLAGQEYCLRLFDSESFYNYLYGISNKAVQSGFSKKELGNCIVCLPPTMLREEYEKFGTGLWARQKMFRCESESLTKLRDTLLPKLLSGQLRIPDAEKRVTEVV